MFNLVPYRKNNNIASRKDLMSELFEDFFNDDYFFNDEGLLPMKGGFRVDIKEQDNNYILEADLPGVAKDAINITYDNNYLTISTSKKDEYEEKRDNYIRKERHFGEFRRSFYVDNIDSSKINAEFKDGVLKVMLPKTDKAPQNKKIEIQ